MKRIYKKPAILSVPSPKIPYEDGFYVYLLRCCDESLYCGWTTNLRKRFYDHVMKKVQNIQKHIAHWSCIILNSVKMQPVLVNENMQ